MQSLFLVHFGNSSDRLCAVSDKSENLHSEMTFLAVARLPPEWPPKSSLEIFRKTNDGTVITVTVSPVGTLRLSINNVGAAERLIEFQRVQLVSAGHCILCVVCQGQSGSISINTRQLKTLDEAPEEIFYLTLSEGKVRPPRPPVTLFPKQNVVLTDLEKLFVESVKDLDQKISSTDHYQLLRASGIIRQLLMDSAPLIQQVNRNYRIKVTFEVLPMQNDLPVPPDTHWCSITPDNGPVEPTIQCTLSQLLQMQCVVHNGKPYTVHDVITCCAHVLGGVHAGKPTSDADRNLVELERTIRFIDSSTIDHTLKGIAQVVTWGCLPLIKAIFDGPRLDSE